MSTAMKFSIFTLCMAGTLSYAMLARGADIFRATDVDGTVRFATQALDPSFVLFMRGSTPAVGAELAGSRVPATPVVETGRVASYRGRSGARPSRALPDRDQSLIALIISIARKHGVDPALVRAVIDVESGSRTSAVSPKGAAGLMQLMPATAAMYGVTERDDPAQNIDAGVRHLKYLLTRHSGNLALSLAAYNAGEGAVARHAGRIPPFRETMLYVPAVLAQISAHNASQP